MAMLTLCLLPYAGLLCRFAQMSCSNWRWGYFSVYNMTSRVRDLDFLVALGDWIYEYENTTYPAANQSKQGPRSIMTWQCCTAKSMLLLLPHSKTLLVNGWLAKVDLSLLAASPPPSSIAAGDPVLSRRRIASPCQGPLAKNVGIHCMTLLCGCQLYCAAVAKGRAPIEPPHELATLEDYRARHKLFHTDAALVEMMRRAPMIAIW